MPSGCARTNLTSHRSRGFSLSLSVRNESGGSQKRTRWHCHRVRFCPPVGRVAPCTSSNAFQRHPIPQLVSAHCSAFERRDLLQPVPAKLSNQPPSVPSPHLGVGPGVGSAVGAGVGFAVGDGVGSGVADAEGAGVGDAVGLCTHKPHFAPPAILPPAARRMSTNAFQRHPILQPVHSILAPSSPAACAS